MLLLYSHLTRFIATTHNAMMKTSSRTSRIAPTTVPMTIPAMAPSERLLVVGAGGWVVGSIRGEILSPVNPFATKVLLDCYFSEINHN